MFIRVHPVVFPEIIRVFQGFDFHIFFRHVIGGIVFVQPHSVIFVRFVPCNGRHFTKRIHNGQRMAMARKAVFYTEGIGLSLGVPFHQIGKGTFQGFQYFLVTGGFVIPQ